MSQPLPGHEEQPAEITCESCGRFVGALTKCPHCGARVHARLTVRACRYAAVLLAVVGLICLYLMAVNKEIPVVPVADISPTMNFAYITVAGTVSGHARVTEDNGRIRNVRFFVDDGTGEISVSAYRAKGQALVDAGMVPRSGDQVRVTGSLSVSAESMGLWLQSPKQLVLERAPVPEVKLGDVKLAMRGKTISVSGAVVSVSAPPAGSRRPWNVTIRDASGSLPLVFWDDVAKAIPATAMPTPGAHVRARVGVGSYRDKIQLLLGAAGDLEVTPSSEPAP